ncbi:hypothetical protein V2J09_018076 [Rumex salicifolius]
MADSAVGSKQKSGGSRNCSICKDRKAALKRPKTLEQICRECFYVVFEDEVHNVIVENQLFKAGERIAIGASGGKDSTVLAYVMSELNRRHNYGLDLFLLSVDEGITGYRDDSLETVKRNEIQALDRGAALLEVDKLVTGHNADDMAETVLLNILRGDIARLSRCTSIITGEDGPIPRCKPFKYTYEKEIAFTLQMHTVALLGSSSKTWRESGSNQSDFKWCKACVLLDGLNRGLPKMGIGRSRSHTNDVSNGTSSQIHSKPCGTLDF